MRTLYTLLGGLAFFTAALHGQAPKPAAQPAAAAGAAKEIVLTGTTANVKESGMPVTIRLFRWSTDEERTALVAAFTAPARGRPGGGGRPAAPPEVGQDQDEPVQTPQGRGQGQPGQARGQGQPAQGRGQDQAEQAEVQGAGRGRGGASAAAPTINPFTQAIQRAPSVGYLWTNEPTGYSVKHASRTSQPDGSERVVLVIDPRLGAYSPAWNPKTGTATDYGFTLLEFRINAKTAEGKSSLTSKVVADPNTKQLALEDFTAAPTILTKVKLTAK